MPNTIGQLPVFLGSVYGGMLIGIAYDIFRLIRLPFGGHRIIDATLDLLFYALAGIIAATTFIRINGGSPRLYALAGIAIGIFAYLKTISTIIIGIIDRIRAKKRKK